MVSDQEHVMFTSRNMDQIFLLIMVISCVTHYTGKVVELCGHKPGARDGFPDKTMFILPPEES